MSQFNEGHGIKPRSHNTEGELLERIYKLNKDKKLVQSRLAAYIEKQPNLKTFSRSRLNEMLKERHLYTSGEKEMGDDLYRVINRYLLDIHNNVQDDDRDAVHAIDEHLFYSLLKSCAVGPINEEVAREQLPGTYIMYRPTVVIPGRVLITFCRIEYDKKTNVISFTEIARERAANEGVHDENGYRWEGYIFNTPTKYFGYQIDQGNGFPRTTILDEHYVDRGKVTQLVGVTMGTLGSANYVSPVYIHRWENEELSYADMLKKDFRDKSGKEIKGRKLLDIHDENDIDLIAYQLLKNRLGNTMVLWDHGSQQPL